MRLSEAIRLGSTMTWPNTGGYFSQRHILVKGFYKNEPATCALGAAAYAMGCRFNAYGEEPFAAWPWLTLKMALPIIECPDCCYRANTYHGLIVHLNDHHLWTREKIADWVEAFEQKRGLDGTTGTASDAEGCDVGSASGDGLLKELQCV